MGHDGLPVTLERRKQRRALLSAQIQCGCKLLHRVWIRAAPIATLQGADRFRR
jgi:hypothetical protein